MPNNKNNIQRILLVSHLLTMLVILVVASTIIITSQYQAMRSAALNNVSQTCSSVASEVDLQIKEMDTISINVIYSDLIKTNFSQYMAATANVDSYQAKRLDASLTGLLTSMRGVSSDVRQINLYNLEHNGFGAGNYCGFLNTDVKKASWYKPVLQEEGLALPVVSTNALISKSSGTSENRTYFSLFRLYYNNLHIPLGIIEVMQYYDITFHKAIYPEGANDYEIYIYDSNGEQIFPLDKEDCPNYYAYRDKSGQVIQSGENGGMQYLYASPMNHSDYTTITVVDSNIILEPIIRSITLLGIALIILVILCFLIAYKLSRRIGAPISHIYHYLDRHNPDTDWQPIIMPDTNVKEIDKLRDSINEFQRRQQVSANTLMLLKEQELQTQMLALQAQMNPHFLYNSLATVSAMAEEGMTEGISQMCGDITEILRYISSNKESLSTLEEELEHCSLFLNCLKLRHGDALNYSIDVEDDMLDQKIPKLSIQLLVENAVKFSTREQGPWNIYIHGILAHGCWVVAVKDTGPGFAPEVITRLNEQIKEINKNGLLPSLELDGMGLLNIYIRLYLQYHQGCLFEVGNMPTGGAIVTIGGKIDDSGSTL